MGDDSMTTMQLTELMLEYQKKMMELRDMENIIKQAVLQRGETFVVADVRATYSGGRKTYDYEKACIQAIEAMGEAGERMLNARTEVRKETNWRRLAEDLGIEQDDVPFIDRGPLVMISYNRR